MQIQERLVKLIGEHVPGAKPVVLESDTVATDKRDGWLKKQIEKGNGSATLKTVSGGMLWAMMQGDDIVLKDEKGMMSKVTQANVFQSNGVIHVVDTVVLPQ